MPAFLLPDLGSGLKEGEVVAWHVEVGDAVTTADTLCEIETEKAVVDVPVPFAGTVTSLAGPEGSTVAVGEVLAVIDGDGIEARDEGDDETPRPTAIADETQARANAPDEGNPAAVSSRTPAMPLVRKLARERGVDLHQLVGTGVGGRITRKDVEAAAGSASSTRSGGSDRIVPMSKLRRSIAHHMVESWVEIPHVFATIDVDVTRLLAARTALSARFGAPLPLEAMVMKAVLPALEAHPELNASVDGDSLLLRGARDIGFAVDGADGLIVPVVRSVDTKSMRDLAREIVDLADRTRARTVAPSELAGATFTVNNIGALGRAMGTSIIPRGTTGILSFGRAVPTPVARDDEIDVAPVMPVSLSFDHRAIDGGAAVRFLELVAEGIEEPTLLMTT